MRLPEEEGLRLVLPRHHPLLCRCFLKSYCLFLHIKSSPQHRCFSGGVCKICESNSSKKQAGERTSQALGTRFPSLPQSQRFLKAVTESWATQCWGTGHTLHLNDLHMTFTALHFNFLRCSFRGELFVILCQDNGMSLHSQILISFPRYQSLHTYPPPEKKKKRQTKHQQKQLLIEILVNKYRWNCREGLLKSRLTYLCSTRADQLPTPHPFTPTDTCKGLHNQPELEKVNISQAALQCFSDVRNVNGCHRPGQSPTEGVVDAVEVCKNRANVQQQFCSL